MNIQFLGHSCFSIQINDVTILVDPFISGNSLASHIDIATLKADYILLTHAHQDHVLDVEVIAERTKAVIVSNYEIAMYYGAKDLNVFALNHGGTFKADEFSAKYVNAIHTSSFADGTYGGEPGGFVLSSKEKNIYIAGDTALTMDMKLIPMSFTLDAAILPIGDTFTMGVEDAILASDLVACNTIIGCHFNTFPPIEIDVNEAKDKFLSKEKELIILEIGEDKNV
ncbi:metal-dependent hydrolase [Polaribacter reichenbachii]|uniref:Hydrolase n=1 Tax=Polaribacter reichenbachii TaxID=996801 RepID=A0A1B8U4J4_9FLAO|nr:metal-dependent hydrolase [Polaribacter reichenbachii]APZ47509.1 metal-dependent hydrolase [Polaribacter reichenbachii]AUC18148.1 metal-dependent hydrolase [Polaribacter reichenbachii]OBY66759.1 hydrolase [Polaribacter reichenbachii]